MHLDVDTLLRSGRCIPCHVKISPLKLYILICARASSRLFRLVCDPLIWRQVFKRVKDFTKETLMKLVGFCTRDGVCREIKAEVVKLAARGIVYDDGMDLKITITIQSWGDPELFAVDGDRFEEVANVEEWVGVEATIVAVQQAEKHRPEVVKQEIV